MERSSRCHLLSIEPLKYDAGLPKQSWNELQQCSYCLPYICWEEFNAVGRFGLLSHAVVSWKRHIKTPIMLHVPLQSSDKRQTLKSFMEEKPVSMPSKMSNSGLGLFHPSLHKHRSMTMSVFMQKSALCTLFKDILSYKSYHMAGKL